MKNKRLLKIAVSAIMALSIVSMGYITTPIDQTLTVSADTTTTTVSSLPTLQLAINRSSETNPITIVLNSDINGNITIGSTNSVTIDLNGKTLTGNGDSPVITNNGGTVTITGNGTVTKSSYIDTYLIKNSSGVMNISNGTFKNTSSISSLICNNATMTIEDGTFTNNFIVLKNDDYATVTIKGGTFTSNDTGATVFQNWSTANILGGTFIAADDNSFAITVNTWSENISASLTIEEDSNSVIGGNVQVAQYAYISENTNLSSDNVNNVPTMVINGGTIEGNIISGNVQETDGSDNTLEESIYNAGSVTINGGSVNGYVAVADVSEADTTVDGSSVDSSDISELAINSGEFSESPLNFINDASLAVSYTSSSTSETVYIIGTNDDIVESLSNKDLSSNDSISIVSTSSDSDEILDLSEVEKAEAIEIINETDSFVEFIMPDITLYVGGHKDIAMNGTILSSSNEDIVTIKANSNGKTARISAISVSSDSVKVSIENETDKLIQVYNVSVLDGFIIHLLELKKQVLGITAKDVENFDYNSDGQVDIFDVVSLKNSML